MGTHVDVAGFARAAVAYERGRPGYPAELVQWLAKVAGIGPFSIVVDVGAGTGKLSRAVAETGARVIAVEPLPEMRTQLRRSCAGGAVGTVEVVDGTAASTGLGRGLADCVTAAQALHWFASPAEVASLADLLRRRGHLAVLWNRRIVAQPIQASLRRLLAPHQAPWAEGSGWRGLVAATGLFEPVDELHVRHVHTLDRDGLVDHVASYAFVPNLPAPERDDLLEAAASLAPAHGTLELEFEADAYVYRRTDRAAGAAGGRP